MFALRASSPPQRTRALALAASLALCGSYAHADDRAEVEQLRATTMALMQALIDAGLLSKDKADEIVRQSQRAGAASVASNAAPASTEEPSEAKDKAKPPVIRVPYISETAKAEMREELKKEVLAQAHQERWGEPGALPDWLKRITVEADLRVRFQDELFDKNNLAPDDPNGYLSQTGVGDAAGSVIAWAPDLANTQHNRDRMTLRARVGLRADLGDGFSAGVRLSTGDTTKSPSSASQTQGNWFNRYSAGFDRAYLAYENESGVGAMAGRFGSPFYGTDLTWPDDLNFDGVAASYKPLIGESNALFMTAGAFPLREFEVSTRDKWLYGAQLGGAFTLMPKTVFRVGLAAYHFAGIEGQADSNPPLVSPNATANLSTASQTEYPSNVRLKGNTLFRLNQYSPLGPSTWGLASKFTPIDLAADIAFHQFDPIGVRLSLDYINNIGFDIDEIRRRTGSLVQANGEPLNLAKQTNAYQAKLSVGDMQIDRAGQWQAMLAFRRLERDAWVDAFTDTTWHLGGTNYQGWSLGGQYGVGPRTSIGVRWTSTRSLPDSTLYTTSGFEPSTGLSDVPLKIDVLQLELNSRF